MRHKTALSPQQCMVNTLGSFVFVSDNGALVKYMEKFFYSPKNHLVSKRDINKDCLIKFSFHDKDNPHFAETGIAKISKIYDNYDIDILIDKKQKFFCTSTFGEDMNLTSGLLLSSLYDDDNLMIFKIPSNYIWCILN